MTNTKVFFIVLCLSALVLFGLPLLRGDTRQTDNQTLTSKVVAGYETKVDEGAVVVTVTPKKLFLSDGQAIFILALDTHNVPLDYDLRELSTVTDDKGSVHRASSWTGGRGGHRCNIFGHDKRIPGHVQRTQPKALRKQRSLTREEQLS